MPRVSEKSVLDATYTKARATTLYLLTPRPMSITAVDYIRTQEDLERQAKELMPYAPDECTFAKGQLRQPVFACVTCGSDDTPVGVCYLCSIQCHADHEIVELFAKRQFVCDCGTTKTPKACVLRQRGKDTGEQVLRPRTGSIDASTLSKPFREVEIGAGEDVPALSNQYNHNFSGTFCDCRQPYDPEDGNMIQCFCGEECGEDWYHEECILGFKQGLFRQLKSKNANTENDDDDVSQVPHFPKYSDFDAFICWKCVSAYPLLLELRDVALAFEKPHRPAQLVLEWLGEGDVSGKRRKRNDDVNFFLKPGFRSELEKVVKDKPDSALAKFLKIRRHLFEADPVYEPPNDDDEGDVVDMGTEALQSLPKEQALKGLEAYATMREKLKSFLTPFATNGEVVTADNVKEFFSKISEPKPTP